MTEIKVFKKNHNIVCVECSGHTGYGEYGEDIVCASLSSIVQTAGLGLLAVAKVNVKLTQNDSEGYYKMTLPSSLSEKEMYNCQIILETMMCGITELRNEYSDFIDLEVIENVF